MRFAKSKLSLLATFCILTATGQAGAADTQPEKVDLASLTDILNSYSTLAELTNDLVQYGFATPEEKNTLVHFMQDRGIQPDAPLERVKLDQSGTTLKWRELSLTVHDDGTLKNSFGQVVQTSGKSLDTIFGETYLSFDHRTARARAMDLFLQEAQADSTGATPVARAWGALTAGIYGGLASVSQSWRSETSDLKAKTVGAFLKQWKERVLRRK